MNSYSTVKVAENGTVGVEMITPHGWVLFGFPADGTADDLLARLAWWEDALFKANEYSLKTFTSLYTQPAGPNVNVVPLSRLLPPPPPKEPPPSNEHPPAPRRGWPEML